MLVAKPPRTLSLLLATITLKLHKHQRLSACLAIHLGKRNFVSTNYFPYPVLLLLTFLPRFPHHSPFFLACVLNSAYRLHSARYNMQMALPSHIPPLEQTREKYKSEIAAFLRETALIVPSSCLCGEVVNSYDTKRQFLVCYDCNVRYHVSCLGISAQDASELDIFQCIMCAQATEGSAGMFSESKSESAAATKDETSCVILRTSSPESSLQSDAIECIYCSRSADDDLLLLCDGCEAAAHTYCLSPPLSKVPRGDWFCETCVFEAESATTSTANGRKRTRNVITSTRTQSGASSPNSPPASQTQVEDGALIQSARSYAEPSNVLISRDSPDKSGHDFGIDDGSVDQEESDIRPISVLSPTNTRDESTD